MHYLIDGYNFFFRIQGMKYPSFEKKREGVIELLNEELGEAKIRATIVFDSRDQVQDYAQSFSLSNLEVIYAPRNRSADEYILEILEKCSNPKNEMVVTSDSDLARQCKYLGGSILTIDEFLIHLIKKRGKKKVPVKDGKEEIPFHLNRLLKIFEDRLRGH